jgi:hypothetical protein
MWKNTVQPDRPQMTIWRMCALHKSCRENQNTQFVFSNFPPFPEIVPILLDNVGKYGTAGKATGDNIIERMRIACWIPKATDTH